MIGIRILQTGRLRFKPRNSFVLTRNFWWKSTANGSSIAQGMQIPPVQDVVPEIPQTVMEPAKAFIDDTLGSTLVDVSSQLHAIQHIGDLKLLGLCSWWPSGWIQSLLEALYVSTGLPWWGTILLGTGIVRLGLFYFAVKAQKGMIKLAAIKPKLEPIQEEMTRAKRLNDTAAIQMQGQKMQKLFRENDVNPLAGFLGFIQIPFFMGFFFGLQDMASTFSLIRIASSWF